LFIEPTVLASVPPMPRVAQEEIFGPVLSPMAWKTEQEAVELANGVPYGLTASIWTDDIRRAHRLAQEVQAGYVWINGASDHFPNVTFGGTKSSGIGREGGLQELYSYTEQRAVNVLLGGFGA
jgi:acyl-CoA reductase-like NAD-dependent aldehyde dehydrogenase